MKRSTLSILNSSLSVTTMLITYILSFVYRTVLVNVMGVEYVGITGLCRNVIQLFSLAELGISWAITFYLYKPLQEKDYKTVAAIVHLLRKMYFYIGTFIAIAGLSVLPFLNIIIKSERPIEHLHLIYFLFLFSTVTSYLFWAHYGILYGADRKNYMLFKIKTFVPVLFTTLQILIIYLLHSFLLAVMMLTLSSITQNVLVRWLGRKEYPYLEANKRVSLPIELKKKIVKYIKATMLYKVSLTIQQSSTGVIISSFIGVATLGIYSNFILIVDTIKGIILNTISPMTAIIGEMNAAETTEYKMLIYNRLNFMMEWVCCLCATCFFVLLNPFVELWLGKDYLLPQSTILLIVIFFYLEFITSFSTKFRDACGLNHIGKFRPLITAILNIFLSLCLVNSMGLNGILLAMVISRLTTITWFEPWVVFRNVFRVSVYPYYYQLTTHTILTTASLGTALFIQYQIWDGSVTRFIIMFLICLFLPNLILHIRYVHSEPYKYYKNFITAKMKHQ